MSSNRLATMFKNVHINHVFIVIVPIDLGWSSLGNSRIVAQTKGIFANVNVIKTNLFPQIATPSDTLVEAVGSGVGVFQYTAGSHGTHGVGLHAHSSLARVVVSVGGWGGCRTEEWLVESCDRVVGGQA